MPRLLALSLAILFAVPAVASADRQDDLAFEVKEASSFTRGQIISKLMTFKLADKCWDKVLDRKQATLGRMGGYALRVAQLALALTEDDWTTIETQSANTKERNRELVGKMIEDFRSRFHITVNVEGDDCAKDSALWTMYLGTAMEAIVAYPPKSGKAFITINVTAKAKGVKTVISKDGTKYTITGARDIEKAGWSDEIEKPFKRVSTKN